jgi:multidrug resistance efflux pump
VWIWISRVLRSLIGLAAIVLAVALFLYLSGSREAPSRTTEERALPVVRAVRVVPQPVTMRWTGYGTARALDASDVAAEVAGRVVEVPDGLEAGVAVTAGDLLARLDPRDYESRASAARRQADAVDAQLSALEVEEARLSEQDGFLGEELEVALRELERARLALAANASNESNVDARLQAVKALGRTRAGVLSQLEVIPSRRAQLRASLEAARADQRLAEDNLGRTAIRAPFDGVVQEIGVEIGEWARAGDRVARVVDLSVIEIPLRVPQSAVGRIGLGDAVDLSTDNGDGLRWAGSVGRIAPESDASNRSATVFVEVRQRPDADAAALLRPGQFLMGAIESAGVRDAMVLPRRAVDAGRVLVAVPLSDSGPEVPGSARTPMVVRSGEVAVSHFMQGAFPAVAPLETQWAVVRDTGGARGVAAGTVVLTSNLETLRPGDLVDIRLETEAGGESDAGLASKAEGSDSSEGTP